MTAMGEKKSAARFTIQFSETDPMHIQVVDILNRQGLRSKAQYIANAVLHYEHCDTVPQTPHSAAVDEQLIESIVRKLLAQGNNPEAHQLAAMQSQGDIINLDDIADTIGEGGIDAIFDALEAFRQ